MAAVLSHDLLFVAPIYGASIVWDARLLRLLNSHPIPPSEQATGSGSRSGTVRYPSGALASGVRVLMQDPVSGLTLRQTTTDLVGRFTFANINADLDYVFEAIDKEPKSANAGVVDESAPGV